MACVTLHPALQSISGRIGSIVFYSSRGQQFARSYVIPRNPDTAAQRERRSLFAEAVTRWQKLSEHSKEKWNRKALGTIRTGYTLFISQFCTGTNSGSENISFIPDKDLRICHSVSAVTSSPCIVFSPDQTTYSRLSLPTDPPGASGGLSTINIKQSFSAEPHYRVLSSIQSRY